MNVAFLEMGIVGFCKRNFQTGSSIQKIQIENIKHNCHVVYIIMVCCYHILCLGSQLRMMHIQAEGRSFLSSSCVFCSLHLSVPTIFTVQGMNAASMAGLGGMFSSVG